MRSCSWIITLLCVSALAAQAAPRPAGDPLVQVKSATARIVDIARAATEQGAMVRQIEGVMAEVVDFQGFSARTLKGRWEGLSTEQRSRFVTAFRGLVISTYAKRFKPGATFRVSYRGPTTYGDAPTANVKTTIHGDKAAADVDYLFAPATLGAGVQWRAIDITVDEVSMARNWRTQFRRILDRDGFDVLVGKIEKKAAKR
ncbi:MAG: ABC transporter substrate-binding protein [Myxococcota bacterium]|nr:ABC transporter substrate-binding protein [Myxococcota bacterium]